MRLSRTILLTATAVGALGLSAVLPATAAAPPDDSGTPSFEEFAASTGRLDDGTYVVNGDELLSSRAKLRGFYEKITSDGGHNDGLVVNTVNGQADRWSDAEIGNLTYCVSTEFGSTHADVVAAMEAGAADWESASSVVNFEYVSSADTECTTSNDTVVFSVEPVVTEEFIAAAFFPSSPDSERVVQIADSIWSSGPWTPSNIIGHELGHTLGFRHEHTRPESGTCFEDSNWMPLTPYDSASIMHYPQCNGTSEDLSMTDSDREGIVALYGS